MSMRKLRADPTRADDKGPALATATALFTSIAFITKVIRIWVRKGWRVLGWDGE